VPRSDEKTSAYREAREAAEQQLQKHRRTTETLQSYRAQLRREVLSARRQMRELQVRLDETTGRLDAIHAELASRTEVE
jgi:septal ring factor EnvC (AmiA/AmiB activator)